MTARISLIPGKTGGHRPPLQCATDRSGFASRGELEDGVQPDTHAHL